MVVRLIIWREPWWLKLLNRLLGGDEMKKEFWKSMTFWGAFLLFLAGGLEAIGVTGALGTLQQIAGILGIPLVGFGIRRAIK